MVHTLEHGAVWITYNPDTIDAGDLDTLNALVAGKPYITLTPVPRAGLDKISLQAWAHQLKVDSASDERVKQFITALRRNPGYYPEIGAHLPAADLRHRNPPAFDPTPPGADAVPMDGTGGTSGGRRDPGIRGAQHHARRAPATETAGRTATGTVDAPASESADGGDRGDAGQHRLTRR